MKEKDITLLLQKADELRALFLLGQKVIPFLEEIFLFMRDIQPLFEEINHSIEENLKKMPNASASLTKVTEANELATTEILDIVDGIFYKADLLNESFKNFDNSKSKNLENAVKLLEVIYKGIEKKSNLETILPQLGKSISALKQDRESESRNTFSDTLNSLRNDASSIMISLQVQDITSQQLAAVNHMLITVQDKLGAILNHFSNTDLTMIGKQAVDSSHDESVNISTMHRKIAFDPIAVESLDASLNRQDNIDDLIQAHLSGENISEEELNIDTPTVNESFNQENDNFNIDTPNNSNLNTENTLEENLGADLPDDFDAEDIDALFASNNVKNTEDKQTDTPTLDDRNEILLKALEKSGNSDDNFSQEDIDALFNQ
jgi:hypothetical protein